MDEHDRDDLASLLFELGRMVDEAGDRDVEISATSGMFGETLGVLTDRQKRVLLAYMDAVMCEGRKAVAVL